MFEKYNEKSNNFKEDTKEMFKIILSMCGDHDYITEKLIYIDIFHSFGFIIFPCNLDKTPAIKGWNKRVAHNYKCSVVLPRKDMLSDNAAMIAWACLQKYLKDPISNLHFKASSRLKILNDSK